VLDAQEAVAHRDWPIDALDVKSMVLKSSPEIVRLMPPVEGEFLPYDVTTGESKLNRVLDVPIFFSTKPTRFKA